MTVLADRLDDYLALRRSLGHKLADAHRLLPRFVSYLNDRDAEFVTVQLALSWATERDDLPAGSVIAANRMMHVRGFAKYLSGIDARTEVPPAGVLRRPHRWRQPFIYTDDHVLALIEHASRLREPLRAATYPTLIGLLASTGLRVGEALRLDRGDLNSGDGLLTIRESKFGKSRHVPLHDGVVPRGVEIEVAVLPPSSAPGGSVWGNSSPFAGVPAPAPRQEEPPCRRYRV